MLKNKSAFTEELGSLSLNILSNAPTPILVTDLDYSIRYVNSSLKKITGFSSSELIGRKPPYPWWPKEQRDKIRRIFQKDIKSGGNSRQYCFQKKNREYFWVQIKGTSIRKGQKLQYYISNWIDITQRKKTDEQLDAERFKLKEYFENLPLLAYNIGLDGKIADCNKNVLTTLGYKSKKELIGKPLITTIYAPSSREKAKQLLTKWKKTGKLKDEELQVITKKGKIIDVPLNVDTIYDVKGKPLYSISTQQDITERKKAEKTLRESEQKHKHASTFLDNILSNMSDYVFVVDEDYNYLFLNEAAKETYKDIAGEKCYKVIRNRDSPCHLKGISCEVHEILDKGKDHFEGTHHSESTGRFTQLRARPITFNGKRAVIVVARDITEDKQAEEALRESEEFSSNLLANSTYPILVANQDTSIKYVNPALEKLTGFNLTEVLGKKVPYPWWPKKQREEITKEFREGFNEGEKRYVHRFQKKDGTPFWVEIKPIPIKQNGKFKHYLSNWADITEHKKMDDELKHYSEHLEELVKEKTLETAISEQFLRSTIENVQDIMYIKDKDSKYVLVNDAYCKFLGKEKEEILSKTVYDLYNKEQADIFNRSDVKVVETGSPVQQESIKLIDKHGVTHILHLIKTPMKDLDGNVTHTIGVARDITERKSLEKMKEQFISAVTHELRTPLVSIKGYTDLLLSPETKLSDDVESDLKIVRQNADRLISLTDDLLDIRRMEAGKLKLNMQKIDLLEIVERCMKEIKPFIKSKQNIELKIDNKPLLIQADRLRLFQIIMNLLVNATKFTPDDGKITVNLREKEDTVELQVSDTGIGIKQENLQRIFEPFANIEKPTYIEGTGLGLSVTKGLVEQHGGKINVTSPGEGKGSTFTFTLPKYRG